VLGQNYYGSSIYATLQLLTTYGLKGDISVRKSVRTAGPMGTQNLEEQSFSMIKSCKQSNQECSQGIPYCSVLPSGFSQQVAKLLNASMMCTHSARRDIRSSGRAERHPAPLVHAILQSFNGLNSNTFRERDEGFKSLLGLLASNYGGLMFRTGSLRKVQVSNHAL
jgi:hypothetical protein